MPIWGFLYESIIASLLRTATEMHLESEDGIWAVGKTDCDIMFCNQVWVIGEFSLEKGRYENGQVEGSIFISVQNFKLEK